MSHKQCHILFSFLLCALCAFVVNSDFARAQEKEKPKPGDVMIDKYLAQETDKLSQRVLDGAKTLDEWQAKLPRLREEYFYMLGLWPLPEKTPLHPVITGKLEADGVVIDKLHFQSKPGLYVTGNLYRPKPGPQGAGLGKLPAILYVCGHSGRGRDGNKTSFQDHGLWFASNGYICLIIDTLQLGEIPGIHHGTYGRPYNHFRAYGIKDKDVVENRWWWQARGYTPAGVECWNGIRAIDYLVSRPDVDPERIGVTGISGGGAATIWIAAADERVKCAVPVSGMSDLESYVKNKIINHHCDCMLLINTYGWEWTTIAALIAPRPMLFCNSDHDTIFPMDGNNRIAARLRQLYKMYDKPELFDDYVSKGGHDYRPDLRIAIFKWINKHLKNDTGPVKDADFKPIAGKELRVFSEDSDVPKDAINGKIDETFVPKAVVKLPEQGKFDEWKRGLLKELRAHCFRNFPDRIPLATILQEDDIEKRLVERPVAWDTEFSIRAHWSWHPITKPPTEKTITSAVLSLGENHHEIPGWVKPLVSERSGVVLLGPRGGEPLSWTRKSPPNYVERSHVLLGRTVDEGRVWDVVAMYRTDKHLQVDKTDKLKLVGRSQAGILAAYAALFEPTIGEVVIVDPPVSHRDGPIFLNVMRVIDIPEALGLLAPRPLTLINAKDKAFDRTAEIYKLAGAVDKFQRK
jgi:cephalosporin-C deacetylase-like acetyl esterase